MHDIESRKLDRVNNDIKQSLRGGVGGRTIVEYLNENKKFLIQNNILYNCDGIISNDGQCYGTLQEFSADENIDDFCFANHRTIIDE